MLFLEGGKWSQYKTWSLGENDDFEMKVKKYIKLNFIFMSQRTN